MIFTNDRARLENYFIIDKLPVFLLSQGVFSPSTQRRAPKWRRHKLHVSM